jgi:crotonobetainyl-CoA:carnitine CoA-transferase CaiB-like acyl-CoA transferase
MLASPKTSGGYKWPAPQSASRRRARARFRSCSPSSRKATERGWWWRPVPAISRPELAEDPRFATDELIAENTEEAVKILREVFATRTLGEWSERFATLAGPWAPYRTPGRSPPTPRCGRRSTSCGPGKLELVANPVQFDVTAPAVGPAPEFAAQTEEVLPELGLDWERILALKAAGAVT